jgi:hypothetical protein
MDLHMGMHLCVAAVPTIWPVKPYFNTPPDKNGHIVSVKYEKIMNESDRRGGRTETPPHVEHLCSTPQLHKPQCMDNYKMCVMGKDFHEDVCEVLSRWDMLKFDVPSSDMFVNVMLMNVDVLHVHMAIRVL